MVDTLNYTFCVRVDDHKDPDSAFVGIGVAASKIWTSLNKQWCLERAISGSPYEMVASGPLASVPSHFISYWPKTI